MLGWLKWGSTGVRVTNMATLDDALGAVRELVRYSQATAEFLTSLAKLEILQGKLVTITLDGTANAQSFPHGLNRPYKGTIVVGNGSVTGIFLIGVSSAAANAAGIDIKTYFTVLPSAADAGDYDLVVF